MTTLSPRELADSLVTGFDRQAEVRLDRALIELLCQSGLGRFGASESAWKVEGAVLRLLEERPPEDLPFRFSDGGKRLVGKARISARDNPETIIARNVERLSDCGVNSAFAVLIEAERLQRQRLQMWLLFGEHSGHLPLRSAVDALVGPLFFPVVQVSLRLFQTLETLALQRRLLRMADAGFNLALAIGVPHPARQRRHSVVRQNIAIQGIQSGIVDVGSRNALAKVVRNHDPGRAAQTAKSLFMQLGPHSRTRSEDQQTN